MERLLRSVYKKATDPDHPEHLAAVRTSVAIIDRWARIYGIDAPTEVVVYSPTAGEIEQWLKVVSAQSTSGLPQEVDVIAGEVSARRED